MSKSILILAAFEPELRSLKERLPSDERITLSEVGIGLVQASIQTTMILQRFREQKKLPHVFFVGSVGCLGLDIPLMSLANISSVSLCDLALARGEGYLPESMLNHYQASEDGVVRIDQALSETGEPIVGAAYTTPSITSSQTVAEQYQKFTQASFENLELYAVAAACVDFQVEWNALCPITNRVGPESHRSWNENFLKASEKLAELFQSRVLPEFLGG